MIRVSARHILVAKASTGAQVAVRFSYDKREPYSAYLTFLIPNRIPQTWEMARELLAFGLDSPTGELDVQVIPDGPLVEVRLSNGDQSAWFTFARAGLLQALEKSYELVPLGAESEHVDWSDVDRFFPGVKVP